MSRRTRAWQRCQLGAIASLRADIDNHKQPGKALAGTLRSHLSVGQHEKQHGGSTNTNSRFGPLHTIPASAVRFAG